jgi:cytochrome P450
MNRLVASLEGDDWKRVRAIMTPTFSTGKLKRMRPMLDECINILVTNIQNVIDKQSADNRGKPNHNYGEFDMKRIFGAFSMDVIIQVAFGTKVDSLNDENNPIITVAHSLFEVNWRFLLFFMFPELLDKLGIAAFDPKVTKFFHALTMRIIEERKKNPCNVKRCDFLQLMMDALENKESDKDNGDSKDSNVAIDALDEEKAKAVEISGMVPSDSADYQPLTTHNKSKKKIKRKESF